MNLKHLQTACYLYNQLSGYDAKYLTLSERYPNLQLNTKEQVVALLAWLRSWGCRQFKKADEEKTIESFTQWYTQHELSLPSTDESLLDYDLEKNRRAISELFDALAQKQAARKLGRNRDFDVSVGPVGAAKTLFALRPNLFSPWDTPIYEGLNLKNDGAGYTDYLFKIQNELMDLQSQLLTSGEEWSSLPKLLGKRHRAYPKMIDEYFWITITRGCDPHVIEAFFTNRQVTAS
ncbi:hypothetical protein SAMN05216319_4519 [Duganella sp. CF402]|uniref:hypothetical protein n=1 Tax=unclassified Duganella TaxID=2636909 RepID=UPI0008BC567C|nr:MULTISPECIES: hypothetical protein [unclassified Duganella]RZT06254.1 hypothetical protein EV582_4583 [Duganella sp. BK701]SEM70427.1 hypothetical protein SAMN05216319_4519 [Duganella sp. CF402]